MDYVVFCSFLSSKIPPQYNARKNGFLSFFGRFVFKYLENKYKTPIFDSKLKKMEKIQIYYGVQGDGMTFGLRPNDYLTIKERFPDAQPPDSIFVVYDVKTDFAKYHANLERYIFPALMGFLNEQDLKQFKKVEFVKTPDMKVTFTIEQNEQDEQEKKSISRQSGAIRNYV